MIVDPRVDLNEGQLYYFMSFETLTSEQLAKAYAYALFTWGDSTQSRMVIDALSERTYDPNVIADLEDQVYKCENVITELRNRIDDLRSVKQ